MNIGSLLLRHSRYRTEANMRTLLLVESVLVSTN